MSTRRILERWREWLPVLLVVCIAAALRFYRVGDLPPGLYRDEAYYGLDALRVLGGDVSIYFAANNGREGLFMYPLAASIALFGRTPEALRITSAAIGTLTVVAMYFAGRAMFSPRVGALSAAILAVNFWHLAISRVTYRAILLPLLLCVVMALLFTALRTNQLRRRLILAALAGAAFGLTLYTYTSAQFVVPLFALYGLSLWIGLRRELFVRRGEEVRQRRLLSLVAFGAAAALVLAPLLLWLTQHGGLYFNRASQVSILNPDINQGDLFGTLLANVGKAAGAFVSQGDRIWRHNLSLRPAFDGFIVVAFVLGVGVCAWRWLRSWQSRFGTDILGVEYNVAPQFTLLWLIVFLVPTILAEDAPHYLRAIGALPAACLAAAVGLETALAWGSRRGFFAALTLFLRRAISPPAFVAALVIFISLVTVYSDYFNDYVNRPLTGYWLEQHNRALAEQVNTRARSLPPGQIWVEDALSNDNPALDFLAGGAYTIARNEGQAVTYSDADVRVPLSQTVSPGAAVALFVDPNRDWTPLRDALPPNVALTATEGPLAQADRDPAPRRAYLAIDAEPRGDAGVAPRARFERGVILADAVIAPAASDAAGTAQVVDLRWSAAEPITDDLAVFVHWVRDGRVIVQSDGSPAGGYLPMPAWRPGDAIVDRHMLAVPGGAQPGDEVHVGAYRREGNQRLRVLEAQGGAGGDYAIISPP